MAAITVRTFNDIVEAVREELKVQSADTVAINRIKRDINFIYLNEVAARERWDWLNGFATITHNKFISDGTVSMTQDSTTVTLTSAPSISVQGYLFKTQGDNEVHRIAQHTAGALTLELESPFTDATAATLSYQIWTDKIPLPTDLSETVEITTNNLNYPLENLGLQEFRAKSLQIQQYEGFPICYTTQNYVDPSPFSSVAGLPALSTRASSGLVRTLVFGADVSALLESGDRIQIAAAGNSNYNGEFIISSVSTTTITFTARTRLAEAAVADGTLALSLQNQKTVEESYRELWIYPSLIKDRNITLNVDYVKRVQELENDADEPLMPLEDRAVLVYGALSRQWVKARNPETFASNEQMFQTKIARMAGKVGDSADKPSIKVDPYWATAKKRSPLRGNRRRRY